MRDDDSGFMVSDGGFCVGRLYPCGYCADRTSEEIQVKYVGDFLLYSIGCIPNVYTTRPAQLLAQPASYRISKRVFSMDV